ncbi:MAG: hypothetical protein V4760_12150, partial [Bdellovibrionota bacterium]
MLVHLASVILVVLFVCVSRKASQMETIVILLGGVIGAIVLIGEESTPYGFLGMSALFAMGILKTRAVPRTHEGGVTLTALTYFYVLSVMSDELRRIFVWLSAPLVLILVLENVASWVPSIATRFFLAILSSLATMVICFHQVSFFDDVFRLREASGSWNVDSFIQLFMVQMTVFWGVLHLSRLLMLFP